MPARDENASNEKSAQGADKTVKKSSLLVKFESILSTFKLGDKVAESQQKVLDFSGVKTPVLFATFASGKEDIKEFLWHLVTTDVAKGYTAEVLPEEETLLFYKNNE